MTKEELLSIGFQELAHFTIMNSLIYDLGRNRQLSVGCIGTPNEMVFICEIDPNDKKNITDLVCLRNYDYDGYTSFEDVKNIIKLIENKKI
jgi:hypothetical protein